VALVRCFFGGDSWGLLKGIWGQSLITDKKNMYLVIIKCLVPLTSHQFKLKTTRKITHFVGVCFCVGVTGDSITFTGVFFGVGVTGGSTTFTVFFFSVGVTGGSTTFAGVFFGVGVTGGSVIWLRVRGLERVDTSLSTLLSTLLSVSLSTSLL